MNKWAALESCSTKIFNENLFIKSGNMVSFNPKLVELHAFVMYLYCLVDLTVSEINEIYCASENIYAMVLHPS